MLKVKVSNGKVLIQRGKIISEVRVVQENYFYAILTALIVVYRLGKVNIEQYKKLSRKAKQIWKMWKALGFKEEWFEVGELKDV